MYFVNSSRLSGPSLNSKRTVSGSGQAATCFERLHGAPWLAFVDFRCVSRHPPSSYFPTSGGMAEGVLLFPAIPPPPLLARGCLMCGLID